MKNETKIKQIKPGFRYEVGEKISGQYYGEKFIGVVTNTRRHSMNFEQTEISVKLKNKITVFGTERETITLSITDGAEAI